MAPVLSLSGIAPHLVCIEGVPWLRVEPVLSERVVGETELEVIPVDSSTVVLALAGRNLAGLRGAHFADPQFGWSVRPCTEQLDAMGVRSFGYQYMEFALPSSAGADGDGLAPWPLRPPAAMPVLWGGPSLPSVLIGPLDHPHESVIAVPSAEHPRADLRAGWHGDLDAVDDLTSSFVILVAPHPREALTRYGAMIKAGTGIRRGAFAADPAVRGLSYWTDNGAEYYYRTAPAMTYAETIAAAVEGLGEVGLPVHAVQLDSWWYHQEIPREIGRGAPVVPPSGALRWEPRPDALAGGFDALNAATGGLPLVLHGRHLAASSSYFAAGPSGDGFAAYTDEESGHAQPADGDLIDALIEQAASWGACTYEQDWLAEIFLTIRGLRERVGRADAWMADLDASAARRGLTLQLCMATPATFLAAAHMTQVSSVRTSMDYRYLADRQGNWGWFLHVNAFARALGLATSKDVFVTSGDEWSTVEACLAALSCGPVGLGDPLDMTDVGLVRRTCREDGVLVQPDVAVAAIGSSFYADPMGSQAPLVGECWTDHPAGRWHYVVACAVADASAPVAVTLDDLDGAAPTCLARHDRDGALVRLDASGELLVEPGADGLDLWTVAPLLLDGRCAVFGDTSKFAAAGDRRIGRICERAAEVSFLVLGVPDSDVTVTGWGAAPQGASVDATTGAWEATVVIGAQGWTRVAIRML